MRKAIDLTGQRFGRLVVISQAEDNKHRQPRWLCQCDCGNKTIVMGGSLKSGLTQSCGCLQRERSVGRHRTHGECGTRLYRIWHDIKQRCQNENYKQYSDYGGRGIRVCDEWQDSFEVFRDWALANGYEESLTIDRIDNDGNYEPENCRWATTKEQARNRRNSVLLEIGGVTKTLAEWAEVFHISYSTFTARYRNGKRGIELVKGGSV